MRPAEESPALGAWALLLALAVGCCLAAFSSWRAWHAAKGSDVTERQSAVGALVREGFVHGFPFVSARHRRGGTSAQATWNAVRALQAQPGPAASRPILLPAQQARPLAPQPSDKQQSQHAGAPAQPSLKEQADALGVLLQKFFQSSGRLADWVAQGGLASLSGLMPAVCIASDNPQHHMLMVQVSWLLLQVAHSPFATRRKLQDHVPAPLLGTLMTAALQAPGMPHGMQSAVLRNCCWTLSSICDVSWIAHETSRSEQPGSSAGLLPGSESSPSLQQHEEQQQLLSMGQAYGRDIVSSGLLATLESLKADFGQDTANFTAALLASLALSEEAEPSVASSAQLVLLQPGTSVLLCTLLTSNRHGRVHTLLCHYLHHMLSKHAHKLVWQLVYDRSVHDLLKAVPQQLAQLVAYQLLSLGGQQTLMAFEADYCVDVPVALAHILTSDQANKLVQGAVKEHDDVGPDAEPEVTKNISLRAVACRMLLAGERLEEFINACFDELGEANRHSQHQQPPQPSRTEPTPGDTSTLQPQPWVTDTVAALTRLLSHLQLLDVRLCEYRANYGAGVEDRSSYMTSIIAASERSSMVQFMHCQLHFTDAASEHSNRRLRTGRAASECSSVGQRASFALHPVASQQQQQHQQQQQQVLQRTTSGCSVTGYAAHGMGLLQQSCGEAKHAAAQHSYLQGPVSGDTQLGSCHTASSTPTGHLSPTHRHGKHDAVLLPHGSSRPENSDCAPDLGHLAVGAKQEELFARLQARGLSAAQPCAVQIFDSDSLCRPLSSLDTWTASNAGLASSAAHLTTLGQPQAGVGMAAKSAGVAGAPPAQRITTDAPTRDAPGGHPASSQPQREDGTSGSRRIVLTYGSYGVLLSSADYSALRKLSGLLHLLIARSRKRDLHKVLRVPGFSDRQNCIAVRALVSATAGQQAAAGMTAAAGPLVAAQEPASATGAAPLVGVAAADALLVWQAADYYQVDRLKEHCEDLLMQTLRQCISPIQPSTSVVAAAEMQLSQASNGVPALGGLSQQEAGSSTVCNDSAAIGDVQQPCPSRHANLSPSNLATSTAQPMACRLGQQDCEARASVAKPSVSVQYIQEPSGQDQHQAGHLDARTGQDAAAALPAPHQSATSQPGTDATATPAIMHAALCDRLKEVLALVARHQHSSVRLQHLVVVWLMQHLQQLVSSRPLAALLSRHKDELASCLVAELRDRLVSVVMLSDTLDEDDDA